MAQRLKTWQSALAAAVDAARLGGFAWGVQDCCLWAANAVLAQTGEDHAAAWRGTYASAEEATTLLASLGGMAALGALAGPEIEVAEAGVGDVGLLVGDWGEALGVCAGRDGWWAVTAGGLVTHPRQVATRAWGVGRA